MSAPLFFEKYGVTPCPRLGAACRLYWVQDHVSSMVQVQHGNNEEHRASFDPVALGAMFESEAMGHAIAQWVNSIHEYERQPVEVS